jgi:hypothetical protein
VAVIPWQTVVVGVAMETLTGWFTPTVIVTVLDVTVGDDAQRTFEVIWHVTTSPFAGV